MNSAPSRVPARSRQIHYTRPRLYPKQLQAIFLAPDVDGRPARYSMIEASTKAGKTAGCIAWLTEQALSGKPGWNYWWVAPIFTQADIAFRRLCRAMPAGLFRKNETKLTVTLFNGVTIWFKSADNADSLYGEDVYGAVIDEASRCKEGAWIAIRSTLTATNGPIRIIGNVKGRKNWFYRMCRLAQNGEAGMHYSKLTAYDAVAGGVLKPEEIEDAKRLLPEHVFRELYLAEPSDDGGNPFGLQHIQACLIPALSDGEPVAWGWDLAKSRDWTVGIALDEQGRVCRFHRFQKPWEETIAFIRQKTGTVPALVDSTGVGDPVLEALQRRTTEPASVFDLATAVETPFDGFKFSAPSKQQLMEGLAVEIQQKRLGFPDGPIRSELDEFEYEIKRTYVRYTAPEGLHDDCVMSLGLAAAKRRQVLASRGLLDIPVLGGSLTLPKAD